MLTATNINNLNDRQNQRQSCLALILAQCTLNLSKRFNTLRYRHAALYHVFVWGTLTFFVFNVLNAYMYKPTRYLHF